MRVMAFNISLDFSAKKIIKHLSDFNNFPVISTDANFPFGCKQYQIQAIFHQICRKMCCATQTLTVAHINIYHAAQFREALPLKCIYLFALRLLLHWTAFYCIVLLLLLLPFLLFICYFSDEQRVTEYQIVCSCCCCHWRQSFRWRASTEPHTY